MPSSLLSPFTRVASLAALMILAAAPSARAFDLWPLAEVTDERTMILYPLYVHEGDFMLVFPFYARTNEGRDHHVLWPMFKMREGRVRRVTPLYFAGDDYFSILPLVYQRPGTLLVAPNFYRFKRDNASSWGFFPFVMRSAGPDKQKTIVPPLYYSLRTSKEQIRWILPWFHSSDESGRTDMVMPLFYRSETGNLSEFWLAPFYLGREGDNTTWRIFPLFTHKRTPNEVSDRVPLIFRSVRSDDGYDFWLFPFKRRHNPTINEVGIEPIWLHQVSQTSEGEKKIDTLLPFGWLRTPNRSTAFAFPLFVKHWRNEPGGVQRSLWVAPWYRAEGPSQNAHAVLPLYFYTDRPRERQQTLNILWPLYRRTQTRDASGEVESYHRRFAIFSDAKEPSGKRTFRILGIAIVERGN